MSPSPVPQNLQLSNTSKSGDIAASWRADSSGFQVVQGGIGNDAALIIAAAVVVAVLVFKKM